MNTNGVPPPGCKVRGCCMGIPIGCGSLALLALLLSGLLPGVFTAGRTVQRHQDRRDLAGLRAEVAALLSGAAFTAGRSVQARQDGRERAERLRVEVEGLADRRQEERRA